ncbi:hypothetical protein Ciccas_013985, partial [Cichlidogyrus casuarinus]
MCSNLGTVTNAISYFSTENDVTDYTFLAVTDGLTRYKFSCKARESVPFDPEITDENGSVKQENFFDWLMELLESGKILIKLQSLIEIIQCFIIIGRILNHDKATLSRVIEQACRLHLPLHALKCETVIKFLKGHINNNRLSLKDFIGQFQSLNEAIDIHVNGDVSIAQGRNQHVKLYEILLNETNRVDGLSLLQMQPLKENIICTLVHEISEEITEWIINLIGDWPNYFDMIKARCPLDKNSECSVTGQTLPQFEAMTITLTMLAIARFVGHADNMVMIELVSYFRVIIDQLKDDRMFGLMACARHFKTISACLHFLMVHFNPKPELRSLNCASLFEGLSDILRENMIDKPNKYQFVMELREEGIEAGIMIKSATTIIVALTGDAVRNSHYRVYKIKANRETNLVSMKNDKHLLALLREKKRNQDEHKNYSLKELVICLIVAKLSKYSTEVGKLVEAFKNEIIDCTLLDSNLKPLIVQEVNYLVQASAIPMSRLCSLIYSLNLQHASKKQYNIQLAKELLSRMEFVWSLPEDNAYSRNLVQQ